MKTQVLFIENLKCASCISTIERELKKNPKIKDVSVNLLTRNALIKTDLSTKSVVQTLKSIGYRAFEQSLHQKESWIERSLPLRAGVSFGISIGLMALHMDWLMKGQGHFLELQAFFSALVLGGGGFDIFLNFFQALKRKKLVMDSLIGISTLTGWVLGVIQIIIRGPHSMIFFDSISMTIAIVLLGRWIERVQKKKAARSVEGFLKLKPKTVIVMKGDGEEIKPLEKVEPGDIFKVKPGDIIPLDGIVRRGLSTVNEALLTGESMPVERGASQLVFAGTTNMTGVLFVETQKNHLETRLHEMISLVESAIQLKPPTQRIVDKVSGLFLVSILIISLGTLAYWGFAKADWLTGILHLMAVLVVACPCALGLATPVAVAVAGGRAAERGFLVRDPAAFEVVPKVTHFLFDKTGTITQGRPEIVAIDNHSVHGDRTLLQLVGSVEKNSNHPVGQALVKDIREHRLISISEPTDFKEFSGEGVWGKVGGFEVWVGSRMFLEKNGVTGVSDGKWAKYNGAVFVAVDGDFAAAILIADTIKDSAPRSLQFIKKLGLKLELLSGDHKSVVKDIADRLGLETFFSEMTPDQKLKRIREIKKSGAIVAFAGDGSNDGPALAEADLSFSMSSGTDIAVESSQVCILHGDLLRIVDFFSLGTRTIRIIYQNLLWAFFYNILMIPLAASGHVTPVFAAVAMSLSSLTVVANSLRLSKWGKNAQ